MAFNSLEYVVFYITILILSWVVWRHKLIRLWLIVLASWYFYASGNGKLLLLMLLATQIDFHCGLYIAEAKSLTAKKLWLTLSLVSNLLVLGFFKYFNFLTGLHWNIVLPLGISFYTFEAMCYNIDIYRGLMKPERSWLRYSCFIAFFPHLIAGPIIRARDFLPQLDRTPTLSREDRERGLYLIFKGVFKKLVLADYLAVSVNQFFGNPIDSPTVLAWLGVYGFAFQIYFDFSGYSDIAVGCAKLIGFDLPLNFNKPYAATSLTDFWRRWHITLSSWLRENLYVSLGGNRKGFYTTLRNIMITMLLGGLWHGPTWMFVIWGTWHGALLCIERAAERFKPVLITQRHAQARAGFWQSVPAMTWTFHLVCAAYIFFRATSLSNSKEVLIALFRWDWRGTVCTPQSTAVTLILVTGIASQWIGDRIAGYRYFERLPRPMRMIVFFGVVILVFKMSVVGNPQPFIYFNF